MASPRMTKDSKRLHELALELGWTADQTRKQTTRYTHPDASAPVFISEQMRGGHGRAMQNAEAQLRRVSRAAEKQIVVPSEVAETVTDKETTAMPRKRSARHTAPKPQERIEVSAKPFRAKHGMTDAGGSVYDSSAVLEVIYDNGDIEYRCTQCSWEHANPRSVAAHYSAKHGVKGGVAKQVKETGRVDPTAVWEPNKLQNAAIARLAAEIERAMAVGAADPRAIATSIVESRARRGEVDPAEPIQALTSDQILAKIRLMLDDGTVQRLENEVAAAESVIEAERADKAALQEKLTETESRLDQFRSSALAMTDLMREIAEDVEKAPTVAV